MLLDDNSWTFEVLCWLITEELKWKKAWDSPEPLVTVPQPQPRASTKQELTLKLPSAYSGREAQESLPAGQPPPSPVSPFTKWLAPGSHQLQAHSAGTWSWWLPWSAQLPGEQNATSLPIHFTVLGTLQTIMCKSKNVSEGLVWYDPVLPAPWRNSTASHKHSFKSHPKP